MPRYDNDDTHSSSGPSKRRRHDDDDDDVDRNSESNHKPSRRSRHDNFEEERPRERRSLSPDDRESERHNPRRQEERRPTRRVSSRSRSPQRHSSDHQRRRTKQSQSKSPSPRPHHRSRAPLPSQNKAFEQEQGPDPAGPVIEKEKPNFALSGRLAAASNTVKTAGQTIVLKYHEPAEARKPPAKDAWRMYVFKNDEIKDTVPLHEQSCWLFGREIAVCDVPVEHPSASKQHAVIQFRFVEKSNEFGDRVGKVKPYIIDLESGNGTFVNGSQVVEGRYWELRDGDVVKFGQSKREYVLQLPKSG